MIAFSLFCKQSQTHSVIMKLHFDYCCYRKSMFYFQTRNNIMKYFYVFFLNLIEYGDRTIFTGLLIETRRLSNTKRDGGSSIHFCAIIPLICYSCILRSPIHFSFHRLVVHTFFVSKKE